MATDFDSTLSDLERSRSESAVLKKQVIALDISPTAWHGCKTSDCPTGVRAGNEAGRDEAAFDGERADPEGLAEPPTRAHRVHLQAGSYRQPNERGHKFS